MDRFLPSLRYMIRLLLKSPGFTITAVLILGFGIGTNTAVFSLISTVLLNPLPFPQADRLVQIFQSRTSNSVLDRSDWGGVAYPDYRDLCAGQKTLDSVAVQNWTYLDLGTRQLPQRLTAIYASPSLFKVTNLPFVAGRPFSDEEDKTGGPLVAVLSESLWRNRFSADSNIVGQSITLSGESFQVVGVCPRQVEDVSTPSDDAVYVPMHVSEYFGGPWMNKRADHGLLCFGRLKEGATPAQANAELVTIQSNLDAQYPDADKNYTIRVASLFDSTAATYSATVWLLGAAVGCLLLISCANVANLIFTRGLERRKEITIRSTLGASRWRLVRELLWETAFLSMLGGVAGFIVAFWSIGLIKSLSPDYLNRFQDVHLDGASLIFIFLITALVSLLSGLLPGLTLSKSNLEAVLREEGNRGGTAGRQRQRTQSILVISQVAFACILLIGAGLLVRSFQSFQDVPLGFNPVHLITANINPTSKRYTDMVQIRRLFAAVLEKARELPGVTDAAMNQEQPFEWTFGDLNAPFHVPGQPIAEPGKEPTFCSQDISSNYFKTMQIAVVEGRDFDANDRAESQHVVIVDTALAEHFFPGENPIGKQIEYLWASDNDQKVWTIIGVVQHVRHNAPDHSLALYQAYFPYEQRTNVYRAFLLLHTDRNAAALAPAIQKIVASIDPDVPADRIVKFDDLIAGRSATKRFSAFLVSIISGAALFLSAVGLYGVLAYSVSQRRRELGVRIALGAPSSNILKLVIVKGAKLAALGLAIGLITTLLLARFFESILYGVSANDPVALSLAIVVLGIAALLACLLPGLRAIRINPITALRE
jgi:putative ABC transport system permease protein